MRKSKIVQSIGLVMVVLSLLVIMLSISVSATSQGNITFSCTEFDSVRGETFTTTVYAQEGSNVTGLDLTLTYNSEYVTLVSYDVVSASEVNVNGNTIGISYADADNTSTALELVELTFSVDDNLAAGLYSDWLVWTNNSEDDAFTTTGFNNGTPQYEDLTIETAFPALFIRQQGDAFNNNYDGKVNSRDATYILQHAAHMFTMPAVDQRYANVYTNDNLADGTAKISGRDATLILQYAAHNMGVTLSDRVNVTFYALDESGNYTVQVVKSVKKGSDLTKLPAVLSMGEGKEGSWSASTDGFATPNFTNITESFNVYAHYEDAVFSITYDYDTQKGAYADGVSNLMSYTEKDSFTLNSLVANEGYEFDGWYNNYGDKVTEIKTGTTGDITLTAKWSLTTYTITYNCGGGENSAKNVFTYDIDDEITFSDATHKSYLFNGWTDIDGNPITKISKGTTGNLELTANWRAVRNIAHPISGINNPIYEPYKFAQEGEKYVFIYYLGYIDNVPLDSSFTPYYFDARATDTEERSTSEVHAEGITESTNKATEKTRGWQSEVKLSSETAIGNDKFATATITAEVSHNQSGSTTTTTEEGSSTTISDEFVSSVTKSRTWTTDDPAGWYRYINYGTIDVFAVITYDALKDKYYISNVNAVRHIGQMWDYSATSSTFDDDIYGELPFEVPTEFFDKISKLTGNSSELGFITQENGTECSVEGYIGSETNVIIPTYLDGRKVTSINANLFAGNTSITSVTFGKGITSIPDGAFEGCTSLASIVFEGALTQIGANAFKGCTLLEFEIPNTVTSIGNAAFDGCIAMDNVIISNTVTKLGTGVFNNCDELSLTVISGNLTMVQTAISSGATNVYVDWIHSETAVDANCTLTVPAIQAFKFDGNLQAFNNLCIVSDAIDTTIEYVTIINSTGENALAFASTNVNLRAMTVESNKTALALSADSVDLIIGGTVTLTAKNGCDGVSANGLNISSVSGEAATFNVTGGNGNPGGSGINANGTLTVSGYIKLSVLGGTGSKGYDGNCGDSQGTDGEDGGIGSVGGTGICADVVYIYAGTVNVSGGIGGQGGSGGCANPDWFAKEYGGDGGTGGTGGTGISANAISIIGGSLNVTGGVGGQGGDRGGLYDEESYGEYGNYGSGGSGGSAVNDTCVIDDEQGLATFTAGTNGSTGTGSDCRDH